jgi:hypothetical protein
MSHHAVTLVDCEEGTAPPEKVVELCVIGDTLFIHIRSYEETPKASTQRTLAQIAVDAQTVLDLLPVLARDHERARARNQTKKP